MTVLSAVLGRCRTPIRYAQPSKQFYRKALTTTLQLNPYSHKPVSYKLVSREVPPLLPKEGSLVWKRAGFARHAVHVTKCKYLPTLPTPMQQLTTTRRRHPTPPRRPPRAPNLRRALARHPSLDRREPDRESRQRRRRALAHFRPNPLPVAGRLPCDAGGADDSVSS